MDKYTLRQNIAEYTCKHFFDGKMSLKGKIIKDLAALESYTLMNYNLTLKNQEGYILDELHKMDAKNSFNFPYGRFKYLHGMLQRLIKESKVESAKPNLQTQPEPPKASTQKRPVCMVELEPDNKPPKSTPEIADSGIAEADLFESDSTHEVWANLSPDQWRVNWENAIAEHRQNHPPKVYSYDEMY